MFETDRLHGVRRRLDAVSWWVALGALSAIGFALLVLPTIIVLATSLNGGYVLHFPPRDLSLRWYAELLNESSADLQTTALTSLRVSSLATVAGVVLATPAAWAVSRRKGRVSRALETVFLSPVMVPGIALGLGILVWLDLLGIRISFTTLVVGHVTICVPYIFRTAYIGFAQLDPQLLEASRTLGARPLRTFRRVTLPLTLPSLLAGAFLGFMYSFDNVPISIMLSDARTEVLPIRLWSLMEDQLDVRVASIAGLLIIVTFVLLAGMERLFRISGHLK
jgi:putative spermidine/putrescine transport system permease protein